MYHVLQCIPIFLKSATYRIRATAFLFLFPFLFVVFYLFLFFVLSMELYWCSSDISLPSKPGTGFATALITA